MTAHTEAQTQTTGASPQSDDVASHLPKFNAKLKHFSSHTDETNNVRRRIGLPVRDWQSGFQSHI
jgi:hypothetical protein